MSDTFRINEFEQVVPSHSGRESNDTRTWRDATELELQQQQEISELEKHLEFSVDTVEELRREKILLCEAVKTIPDKIRACGTAGQTGSGLLTEAPIFHAAGDFAADIIEDVLCQK